MSKPLIAYLPGFYGESPEVRVLQGALDSQVRALWAARDGLFDQLDLSKATWGLRYWEEALGIPVEAAGSYEFRRSRIKAKLRGQGTTTVAMIQNVAESFSNGAVDVIEHPAEYRFDVKFTGTIGIPPNLEDLSAAIGEIKPAHLDYDYIIIYRTWGQIRPMTWGTLKAHTWGTVKGGSIE